MSDLISQIRAERDALKEALLQVATTEACSNSEPEVMGAALADLLDAHQELLESTMTAADPNRPFAEILEAVREVPVIVAARKALQQARAL